MSGLSPDRGTGRYSEDGRSYVLANSAAGAAIAGVPAPFAAGLTVRGLLWNDAFFAGAFATAVVCGLLLAIGGILAFLARRSLDPITSTRRRIAVIVIAVTLVVGVPVSFFFSLYGDPAG